MIIVCEDGRDSKREQNIQVPQQVTRHEDGTDTGLLLSARSLP